MLSYYDVLTDSIFLSKVNMSNINVNKVQIPGKDALKRLFLVLEKKALLNSYNSRHMKTSIFNKNTP